MSTDGALKPVTPEAEQPLGHEHGPRALGDRQLLDLLQIKSARFYALKAQGAFRFLELKPQVVGMSTRYSRAVVDRWLAGEDVSAPLSRAFFGQKSAAAVAAKSRRGRRPRDGVHVEPRKPKADVVSIYQWRHEHEAERRTA